MRNRRDPIVGAAQPMVLGQPLSGRCVRTDNARAPLFTHFAEPFAHDCALPVNGTLEAFKPLGVGVASSAPYLPWRSFGALQCGSAWRA